MLFDPFLVIGLLLFFFKLVRKYYYFVFATVAGLHVFALTFNPIKDDFWWTFLYSRVFVDAVTILGLGVGLKYLNSQKTKEVVKNMRGMTLEGGWEKNIFWVAPIIVMAIGLAPMPYGYYTLLKLVVCGCSIYYAYHLYEKKDQTFVWVFGFFAILYNPIIPIYLYEKQIWTVVNIITAAVFILKRDAAYGAKKD